MNKGTRAIQFEDLPQGSLLEIVPCGMRLEGTSLSPVGDHMRNVGFGEIGGSAEEVSACSVLGGVVKEPPPREKARSLSLEDPLNLVGFMLFRVRGQRSSRGIEPDHRESPRWCGDSGGWNSIAGAPVISGIRLVSVLIGTAGARK